MLMSHNISFTTIQCKNCITRTEIPCGLAYSKTNRSALLRNYLKQRSALYPPSLKQFKEELTQYRLPPYIIVLSLGRSKHRKNKRGAPPLCILVTSIQIEQLQ